MTSSIIPNLDTLKKAQRLDSEIHQSKGLLEEIPSKRAQLKAELESEKGRLHELEKSLKDIQVKLKDRELELSQKEMQIKKLDGQLSQVKTNKEYAALQQEVASLKADNSLLEEGIIHILDEVDAAKDETRKEKEKLVLVTKSFQEKEDEMVAQEKGLQTRLADMQKQREEAVALLPPELRELYSRISLKKQGLALAAVNGESCAACQMKLRPQLINEIRLGEQIIVCENCSRILYFEA